MGSFDKLNDKLNKLNERFSAGPAKKEQRTEQKEDQKTEQKKDQKMEQKKDQKISVDGLELLERISDDEAAIDALKAQIGDLGKSIDKVRVTFAKKDDLKIFVKKDDVNKIYVTKEDFDKYKADQEKIMTRLVDSMDRLLELMKAYVE